MAYPQVRKIIDILLILFSISIIILTVLIIWSSDLLDFQIYYYAAERIIQGKSPYDWFGIYRLPYQYFPWLALLFIPLTTFPIDIAWYSYNFLNILLLGGVFAFLLRRYDYKFRATQLLFIFASALLMIQLVFRVGQIGIIQLVIAILIIWTVDEKKPIMAGLLFPFLLIKPHLVLLFIPAIWLLGGKRIIIACLTSTAIVIFLSNHFWPGWLESMVNTFLEGQLRNDKLGWNFTTPASLFGLERGWNYLVSVFLLPLGAWIAFRYRHMATFPWLSFVLALSLFAAPYSFAYDLPLLIPLLVWLSPAWSIQTALLWMFAGLIPFGVLYSSPTYLITVISIGLVIIRGEKTGLEID